MPDTSSYVYFPPYATVLLSPVHSLQLEDGAILSSVVKSHTIVTAIVRVCFDLEFAIWDLYIRKF